MSEQRQAIELSPQQFMSRFEIATDMYDPFTRHYLIANDSLTGKRAIYKHYLAQTQDQQEAIYDNISNYIRLSQHEGICKILACTRLIKEQEILAAFQYNDYTLGEYIRTSDFSVDRVKFYVQLLKQVSLVIGVMSQIGIDMDQLNYGNILVSVQVGGIRVKFFYDQREKSFQRVLEGQFYHNNRIKTFTSLQKLSALIYGLQEQFVQRMQSEEGISSENVYQLGLLMIDVMYKCESVVLQKEDGLVRDQPVSRVGVLEQERGYYFFEDGVVRVNSEYLQEKVKYLSNSAIRVVKQLTALAQSMIVKYQERVSIYQLSGEIDRVEKIYRDSSKKTIRAISVGNNNTNSNNASVKKYNQYESSDNQNIVQNSHTKNIVIGDNNRIQSQSVSRSVNASNALKTSQRRPFEETSNEVDVLAQMERSREVSSSLTKNHQQHLSAYNQEERSTQYQPLHRPMAKNKNQLQENQLLNNNNANNNTQHYYHPLNNQQQLTSSSQSVNRYTNTTQKDYLQNSQRKTLTNTLANTKESLIQRATHIIHEQFTQNSNLTITHHRQNQHSKPTISHNNLDVSNQKPPKITIPKDTILANLKTYESIHSSLSTLLNQLQNLPQLRKKQYYDNSVYYGGVSHQTNKRKGLGVYLYPSGDIYFGTWLENQLVDGTYVFKNGESYQGTVRNGKQGWGRYRYSNGNVYEGEWKDDIKQGKGTMWYPNMDKYQGQWMKGKKNGWGKYHYNNGTQYEGNFLNGRKQGFGTITFPNGTRIQANWQQTHIQGQGKVFYPNGDFFHGQYQLSQKHGKGLYVWGSDNTKYDGEFKKDSLQGQAKIYFTDKQHYFGRIRNGRRDGQGSYVYENGDSFTGEWKTDVKVVGCYKFRNGDQFEGKFKDNQLNFGLLKYNNGEHYEGEFRNGCRHGVGTYKDSSGQVVCEGHWENDNFISSGQ